VDLKSVIEAAIETVRPAANAKELLVQTILDPAASAVMGAPDRLQQVVWNLLMNSVKFTPRRGRIQVQLRRADSYAEIVVSDTGEGIAAELLPHIFERFRQGDSSSTRAHGGLGIGLALVRHLVDLHGGTVSAQSDGPGRGATFTVRLPVALARIDEAQARPDPNAPTLHGVTVVIVDDDPDSLELARIVLAGTGADVRACRSAGAARHALATAPADILVIDIEMPGEDGLSLIASLRDTGNRTPAIALTAYGRGEDRKRALAAGFNLHLTKPVDPSELTIAIASLTGHRP
jgi:CheY-like chemotaxis protein